MTAAGEAVPRPELIERLTALIGHRAAAGCLRVGIDGPDAAGKTTLAGELATALSALGRPVVRASIDGFHRPAAERHRSADADPGRSYYEDSFDYEALRGALLDPLGPGGSRRVRRRVFDYRSDLPAGGSVQQVADGSVLLFDGVFLLRSETAPAWDLSIYVRVRPEVTLRRALGRDGHLFGSAAEIEARYRSRYLPGQERYRAMCDPEASADVLIVNDDPALPVILRMPGRGAGA